MPDSTPSRRENQSAKRRPEVIGAATYTADRSGTAQANIWIQPIDGKPVYQLTNFTDGKTIGDFAWSRDGKRLAISRVSVTNDIVLFKGLKQ